MVGVPGRWVAEGFEMRGGLLSGLYEGKQSGEAGGGPVSGGSTSGGLGAAGKGPEKHVKKPARTPARRFLYASVSKY